MTALGVEAVKAGKSVYFSTLANLIAALARAEREGRLQEKIRFFCRPSLLVVDEIGYLPVVAGDGGAYSDETRAIQRVFARAFEVIVAGIFARMHDFGNLLPVRITGFKIIRRNGSPGADPFDHCGQ